MLRRFRLLAFWAAAVLLVSACAVGDFDDAGLPPPDADEWDEAPAPPERLESTEQSVIAVPDAELDAEG